MDIRLCLICQSTSQGHSHQWKNKNGVSTGEYFLIRNITLEWNNIVQNIKIFNETSLEIKEKKSCLLLLWTTVLPQITIWYTENLNQYLNKSPSWLHINLYRCLYLLVLRKWQNPLEYISFKPCLLFNIKENCWSLFTHMFLWLMHINTLLVYRLHLFKVLSLP